MYRRDYLLRMIEQFTVTMAQVLLQRQNRRLAEAMELIAQAMKQLLGLNSKLVRALSVKDIIGLLSANGHFDAGKGLLLSDMLKAEGELLGDAGEPLEAESCFLKSLELLLEIRQMEDAEELHRDAEERVSILLPQVKQTRMNLRLMELLLGHYDATGQLAKAEDMLFFMLDDDPGNPKLVERGIDMYERWSELEPEQWAEGNLSGEEIQESRELLIKMKQNGS